MTALEALDNKYKHAFECAIRSCTDYFDLDVSSEIKYLCGKPKWRMKPNKLCVKCWLQEVETVGK